MKLDLKERDRDILNHIILYCDQVQSAVDHFGNDKSVFMADVVFRNAVGMPIQTIGELTRHFSDEFIANNQEIPWRQIRGMRNYFAHKYWDMDSEAIWKTVVDDIPQLRESCQQLLEDNPESNTTEE